MATMFEVLPVLLFKNMIVMYRNKVGMAVRAVFNMASIGALAYASFIDRQNQQDTIELIRFLGPFFIQIFYISGVTIVVDIIGNIMSEKSSKTHQLLRTLGVGELSYLASWVLAYLPYFLLIWALPTIILSCFVGRLISFPIIPEFKGELPLQPKVFVIMFFNLFYMLAYIPFCYMHCAFFSSKRAAKHASLLTFMGPAVVSLMKGQHDMGTLELPLSIIPFIDKFSQFFHYFHPLTGQYQLLRTLFIDFVSNPDSFVDLWSFSHMFMLILPAVSASIMCGILGTPVLHFCSVGALRFIVSKMMIPEQKKQEPMLPAGSDLQRFAADLEERPIGISVRNATKTYSRGTIIAVDQLNLQVYVGETFALLGYNGSGKTSLMECLMGIQTLTSGQVLINGIDTKENPVAALHNVGICPKFDGACRSLTVLENLLIFCRIKGLTALEASCDAKDIMIQLGLTDWAHFRIKSLPSGLQRKVSVAIAFCGGSDVVLLDQPSKGMDLKSASELWHNIGIMKKGKTIVFTTHSVEEAESQADRIGIMAAGTLQCLGSNIFLRKYLGSGYTLSISSQYRNSDAGNGRITVAISQNVKGAQLVSCHGGELIFTLPQQIAAEFQDIFKWIERHKHELGIKDYTLTPSRLVDVFLRTIREHDQALGRTPKPLQPIPEFQRERVSLQSQSSMIMLFLFIYLRSDFSYMISFFPPLIVLVIAALIPPLLQVSIILFCISVSGTLQASHLRIQMDVVGLSPLAYWFTCIVWNFLLLFVPFCVFLAVLLTFSGSQHIMWLLTAPCLCFASTAYACFLRVVAFRVSSFSIQYSLLIIPMAVFSFFFVARYSPIRLACYIFHPAMFVFALESETDMLLSCSTVNLILAALGFFLYSLCFVEHCLYIYQGASLCANRSKQPQLMTTHNFGENVTDEIERVRNTPDDLLQLRRVSRLSGNKVAIREVTVGIHGGSSVGFLGANGSGKTSMIECLLGQAAPDFGSAHVTGFDVAKSPIAARSRVGYAAQFDDALILSLSARQQLHLYARVVGIPEVVCEDVVTRMIDGVGLIHGADRPSGTYSSGMKRKLSVAMALIGQRPVVLMDQPTTGVDPASRRHMWAIIDEVRSDPNRCVLLTTHALDETEALCDRIVFFVNGEVKFIGSPNQLRAKFSLQYRVEISFDLPKDVSQIRGWILETFPGATVAEINERRIRVHVPKAAVNSVAILYSTLHSDHGLPITDVTVGADSLDEIMMSVAEQSAMGNTLVSVLPST